MKISIQTLIKARSAWHDFRSNHPDLLPFLEGLFRKGVKEGTKLRVLVTFSDGEERSCDLTLKQNDLPFFDILGDILD